MRAEQVEVQRAFGFAEARKSAADIDAMRLTLAHKVREVDELGERLRGCVEFTDHLAAKAEVKALREAIAEASGELITNLAGT